MARIKRERPETEKTHDKHDKIDLKKTMHEGQKKHEEQKKMQGAEILKDIERDIYSEAGVFDCFDNDQINNIEQGFMHGYISAA